ncbi:MAG: Ldh family oxidoreductase [Anaerolineaceae bacterium]
MSKTYYYDAADLHHYIVDYFMHWKVLHEDADMAADVLLAADMRGVDSHGVIRLSSYYGSRLRKGLINPNSPLTVLKETLTTLALDGGNGLGHPLSVKAMRLCIEKAQMNGVALATLRNSNHFGIAGYYAMMALPEDMIGVCFTNTAPLVAPTNSRKAMLGTNPIAVAVPTNVSRPFVLDMATSIVPMGRIDVFRKEGKSIPAGWGVDAQGKVTENPAEVREGGALMPLGGPEILRGYKGYGLALMVDIFSGVLSGAAFGEGVSNASEGKPCNVGHFFGAVRIDAFRSAQDFKTDMDTLLDQLRNAPKSDGEERIYIHGEKEFEAFEKAKISGVPLTEATVKTLVDGGNLDGKPFDIVPMRVEEGNLED